MDTKMNQLTNQMSYYGGKSISIIQSGLNNNNNNTHNSKNSVNIIEAEEILEGGGNIGNTSVGGNNNNLQVNLGTTSKGCLVNVNVDHWLKDFQTGRVTKIFLPKLKGPTKVTTSTGIFDL